MRYSSPSTGNLATIERGLGVNELSLRLILGSRSRINGISGVLGRIEVSFYGEINSHPRPEDKRTTIYVQNNWKLNY